MSEAFGEDYSHLCYFRADAFWQMSQQGAKVDIQNCTKSRVRKHIFKKNAF